MDHVTFKLCSAQFLSWADFLRTLTVALGRDRTGLASGNLTAVAAGKPSNVRTRKFRTVERITIGRERERRRLRVRGRIFFFALSTSRKPAIDATSFVLIVFLLRRLDDILLSTEDMSSTY